jgi:exopolyphosphatase/guanosine-5'-triphosphate,3'-diphosphate pyrophosphatase
VATSAVREAANRERLLGPLRREHGVVARVLSGREEARLGGLAALHGLSLAEAVVADLGGGSLQLCACAGAGCCPRPACRWGWSA